MAGFWQPMVAERKVVILTHDGTTAFDADTGHIVWCYTRQHGHRMIYDGRVYMIDQAYYTILDLQDGRELLRVRMLDQLRQKWGLDDVGISTGLLVSETHAFFGDGAGRLFAVERDTGEPVWFDRPKGTRGYLGVIPVVAGNRLYITTFSMDPKRPGQLYCYEGAGLGA
jgi:outer membrane protein assembly factor BamB